MIFQIIPVAEANVDTLMRKVDQVILNPLIKVLFALAMVYFIYGLLKYLFNPDSEEIRKSSKSHMLWGVIGMFIMVSVFGIMNFILTTLGETNVKVDTSGNYSVTVPQN